MKYARAAANIILRIRLVICIGTPIPGGLGRF